MSVRVFRPQVWRIRATRRGYQRARRASQSTGGAHGGARGPAPRVTCHGSCAAATPSSTRSAPAAWARSGGRGTVTSGGGWPPSCWRAVRAATTRRRSTASCASSACACGIVTSSSRPTARPTQPAGRCSRWTSSAAAASSSCSHGTARSPTPMSVCVLEQTLEALVAVHAAGVVHRDVKPGNLLLEPTGTGRPWVRLGDFGVAVTQGDTATHAGPEGSSVPARTWPPSRSPARRPTRVRTSTPPGWSPSSCSPEGNPAGLHPTGRWAGSWPG